MAIKQIAVVVLAGLALGGCATTVTQNSNCLTDTGSRIPGAQAACAPGRSYSSADIERTGKTNAGDALAQLDPSITVHH